MLIRTRETGIQNEPFVGREGSARRAPGARAGGVAQALVTRVRAMRCFGGYHDHGPGAFGYTR